MEIAAILVLYNPSEAIFHNIETIQTQVSLCIVIINSCSFEVEESLRKKNVKIIRNETNIGLAAALNIGLKAALGTEGLDAVILFDQDSRPGDNCIANLITTYKELGDIKVGALGCKILDQKEKRFTHTSPTVIEQKVIITSGCFIPIKVLKEVGLMDEVLFIDYIDYEWCFRAIHNGYKIFVNNSSVLFHNMGDKFINFLGKNKPIHINTLRQYYIIRNQLIIIRRPYIPLPWRISEFFKFFYRIPGYILYSAEKFQTASKIFLALKDYWINRNRYKSFKY